MKIINLSSDEAVLRELGQRLAAARLQQNLTQMQLAEQAGISKSTLQRLESGEAATQLSGFVRVCRALGLLEQFETLVPEPVPSPMAQLKLQGRQRQRASSSKAAHPHRTGKKWTWGEPE
jgi:transcriptional regulator with XRE-family HTH domain